MKNSTTFTAFITALALHLLIGAVILLGMDFKFPKDKPKQEVIINASVVSQKLFDDLASRKAQQEADKLAAAKRKADQIRAEKARIAREKKQAEQQRKDAERKRVEAEKAAVARKKKEEDRIRFEEIVAAKAERAKKAAEVERKKQEAIRVKKEAERVKRQAEIKRVEAEKLAAAKALKEKQAAEAKLKAAKEAKLKAEKEAKLKAERAAKLKAERQKAEAERLRQAELDKQMEAEFADAFSSAQSSKQLSEIARYKALIQDKISRNWQVEPSMKGKTCTLAIRLAPDGLVLTASRSKGDQKLCDSAKRATLRAKTLPIPKDPEIAMRFRDFDITLEPDF